MVENYMYNMNNIFNLYFPAYIETINILFWQESNQFQYDTLTNTITNSFPSENT